MKLGIILPLLLFISTIITAAPTGRITGTITESETASPLPGANVMLEGTSFGTASDRDGNYRFDKIPPGEYILVVNYIGYHQERRPVVVQVNRTAKVDVKLDFEALKGEEVVVTAQMEGQARAINQQLAANTIVNVVSPDKIQELPDQNAAESLARLPGISVQRDAGEGQKVVVRGLSPKFNSITVNGERIPSTDPEDRSVDLTMISPDVLAGIEVFKALTPDMDADAVGGTVNFVTRKASDRFNARVRLQKGYNDHEEDYSPYKGSATVSNRFLNKKLGLVLTGSTQKANRGSDVLDGSYFFKREKREGEERALIEVNKLNLADRRETRMRNSAGLAVDYQLDNGDLFFTSFWGNTERDEVRRRIRYNIEAYRTEYDLRDRQIETQLWSNLLSGRHYILPHSLNLDVNWRTSYSQTKQNTPFSHYARFYELGGFTNDLIDDQGPELIPLGAERNMDETFFKRSILDNENVLDQDLTAQLDFKRPFKLGIMDGYFKFGGKYREKRRERDKTRFQSTHFGINDLAREDSTAGWELTPDQKLKVTNFIDPDYNADNFLEGAYEFYTGLDRDKINDFYDTYRDYYLDNNEDDPLYMFDPTIDLEDYKAGEQITAAYAMMEVNLGRYLMILPGVRYEKTENDYESIYGTPRRINEEDYGLAGVTDTTGYRQYEEILPMMHLRIKPAEWFDIRLAATKTLSRPNYFNLVPWQRIEFLDQTMERGDPDLKHAKVWNYDAYISLYNRLGLFTLGYFYKSLQDIDYIRTSRIQGGTYSGFTLTQPENADGETVVKGFEIELQTNLKALPSPFDGIVIYANYSRIYSETYYPLLVVERGGPPFFQLTFIDSIRVGRMPGQAQDLANFTLGYEKGGFSSRLSMIYQGESLSTIGTREELDGFTDSYIRWDFVLKQKMGRGFSLFLNVNNLTNQSERSYLGIRAYPTAQEYFGWTGDIGLQYEFK